MTTDTPAPPAATAPTAESSAGSSAAPSAASDAASGAWIEPDPDRVQYLDPRTLLLDANIRHDHTPSKSLISSVRDHGILQPVIAVATGDGRARVRYGHRRTLAAIATQQPTARTIVLPTEAAADALEQERLVTQYVENTQREDLTPAEQLDVFAGLHELGMTAGQIATATKARRRDIVDGLKAARVPQVRDAVTAANLRLDQAAILEEFADDSQAYEQLLNRLLDPQGWGMSFEHLTQRLRDDRDEAAARDEVLAELRAAGVPVVERPDYGSATTRLSELAEPSVTSARPDGEAVDLDAPDSGAGAGPASRATADVQPAPVGAGDDCDPLDTIHLDDDGQADDGNDDEDEDGEDDEDWDDDGGGLPALTPEQHASCPGHAAFVRTTRTRAGRFSSRGDRPTAVAEYVCTDPAGNGHQSRHGGPLRAGGPAAVRADESPEQAAERLEQETEAKRAARRRVRAGNVAWDSATTVRRRFLAEQVLGAKTPPAGARSWMAAAFVIDRYTVCRAAERGHQLAAELLTPHTSNTASSTASGGAGAGLRGGVDTISKLLDGASENRSTVIMLGMVLGAIEGETGRHHWRQVADNHRTDTGFVRYLQFLVGLGYPPAPIERFAAGEDIEPAVVFDTPPPAGLGTHAAPAGDSTPDSDSADGGHGGAGFVPGVAGVEEEAGAVAGATRAPVEPAV